MNTMRFVERPMTDAEFARMNAGFDEYTIEQGRPLDTQERHGFVVLDGDAFVGCASGLAYKWGDAYTGWFYLSDLFIEKPYRGRGLGAEILSKLEARVTALGMKTIFTWTADYEAPGFYKAQGYEVFYVQENWHGPGHSRFGLRKELAPCSPALERQDR